MPATLSARDLTFSRGAVDDPRRRRPDRRARRPDRRRRAQRRRQDDAAAGAGRPAGPDRGRVQLAPPAATVGYLPQEPERRADETVPATLLARRTGVAAASGRARGAPPHALAGGGPGADDRYAAALDRWLALGGADLDARAGEVLADLGLRDRVLDQPTTTLSGGQAARLELAAVLLLSRFDVLLLDEPTNDLDFDGLDRLEALRRRPRGRRGRGQPRPGLPRADDHAACSSSTSTPHRRHAFEGGWLAYLDERDRPGATPRRPTAGTSSQRDDLRERARRQRAVGARGRSAAP